MERRALPLGAGGRLPLGMGGRGRSLAARVASRPAPPAKRKAVAPKPAAPDANAAGSAPSAPPEAEHGVNLHDTDGKALPAANVDHLRDAPSSLEGEKPVQTTGTLETPLVPVLSATVVIPGREPQRGDSQENSDQQQISQSSSHSTPHSFGANGTTTATPQTHSTERAGHSSPRTLGPLAAAVGPGSGLAGSITLASMANINPRQGRQRAGSIPRPIVRPRAGSLSRITKPVSIERVDAPRTSIENLPKPPNMQVELSKMKMSDFIKGHSKGRLAPSMIRRKELLKQKRERDRENRRLGLPVESPKKKRAVPAKRFDVFDEDNDSTPLAPKIMIKDGKIVLDTTSIVHKPKEEAIIEDADVEDEEVKRITSMTYSKRKGTLRWTTEETKLFYMALQQCGQDFTMIAQFFPSRDRREICRKFKREAKDHAELIEQALNPMVSKPVNTGQFANNELVKQLEALSRHHLNFGTEPPKTMEEAISATIPDTTQELPPPAFELSPNGDENVNEKETPLARAIEAAAKNISGNADDEKKAGGEEEGGDAAAGAAAEGEDGIEDEEEDDDDDDDDSDDSSIGRRRLYSDDFHSDVSM